MTDVDLAGADKAGVDKTGVDKAGAGAGTGKVKPVLKVSGLKKHFPVKKGLLSRTVGQDVRCLQPAPGNSPMTFAWRIVSVKFIKRNYHGKKNNGHHKKL